MLEFFCTMACGIALRAAIVAALNGATIPRILLTEDEQLVTTVIF